MVLACCKANKNLEQRGKLATANDNAAGVGGDWSKHCFAKLADDNLGTERKWKRHL